MIHIALEDLKLYQTLIGRSDKVSRVLSGFLLLMEGDATSFLQYITKSFPSYTDHSLQHSWRIVENIGVILTDEAMEDLSSTEIFTFITAAAFHDSGIGRPSYRESMRLL